MPFRRSALASLPPLLAAALVSLPSPARAHCDTLDGPVVKAARQAIERRDPSPALSWVQKDGEAEVKSALLRTLAVRGGSAQARELADTWFLETVVRLHRAGEGAPYGGLKPAGTDLPHAVVAADKALEGGVSVDTLARHVSGAVDAGIRKRFAETAARRKHATESVEAGREYVKAYVDYVHYVEAIAARAEGHGDHAAEGAAPQAHQH